MCETDTITVTQTNSLTHKNTHSQTSKIKAVLISSVTIVSDDISHNIDRALVAMLIKSDLILNIS